MPRLHRIACDCEISEDPNAGQLRLKGHRHRREFCLDNGMTCSSCHPDHDGNRFELQAGDLGPEGPPVELPQVRA
jgi:hypothetical protein